MKGLLKMKKNLCPCVAHVTDTLSYGPYMRDGSFCLVPVSETEDSRQTDRQMDGWMNDKINRYADTDRYKDGWTDGRTDR